MRFSLGWIKEYVEITETPEVLAQRLTMAGLPVDSLEPGAEIPDTVVVGRVLDAVPHPNADRLTLCTVEAGRENPLTIVCGAPNARKGIYSPVALVGTALPNGVTIRKAKIRGEISRGMLCSAIELGMGDDADGILEIPTGEPGTPFARTPFAKTLGSAGLGLDIDVPSNRGDCLSHLGMAREIAALTGRPVRLPGFDLAAGGKPTPDIFKVTVEDPRDCPRFTAHIIRGVKVGPSPEWLRKRLESIGQRSINNIVDITNFVLQETGQPLHAFDLDRLGTGRIHVRRGKNETITTLDGVERRVGPEVLLITDGERPVAVAGVMGGANTEVHEKTTDILLEAAFFRPERVLWGSRKMRLDTDASQRFRRGVDPEGVAYAAKRAAAMIAEHAGGTVAPGMTEVMAPGFLDQAEVTLRPGKVGEVLGDPVRDTEIKRRLEALGFTVRKSKKDSWVVSVPTWRRDIVEECDLVEEVARHRGYDTIGERQYNASGVSAPVQPEETRVDRVREVMNGFGYHEAVTRTLVEKASGTRAGLPGDVVENTFFPILDPPSTEEEGLRVSLIPSLLQVVSHNLRHGRPDVRVYEIGKTFCRPGDDNGNALPQEETWVGVAASGGAFPPTLERAPQSYNFLDFKGMIEGLLSSFRIDGPKWRFYTGIGLIPEGATELLVGKDPVGFVWEVSDPVRDSFDLSRPVYVAGLRLAGLPLETGSPLRYRAASRFPVIKRDMALVVPESLTQEEVRTWIQESAGPRLGGLELFDYYRGEHIPEGHLGMGYRLTFRADDRTLEESEVDATLETVVRKLKDRGIARREG